MPGITSDYSANLLVDIMLGTSAVTLYLAMMVTAPADDGTGGTEVAGGSYARVSFVSNAGVWPAAASRQKKNATTFTFPAPTADWGTDMWGLGIYDAAAAGNPVFFFKAGVPFTVLNGDPAPVIAIDSMTIRMVNTP
jgi:hypothetical protein